MILSFSSTFLKWLFTKERYGHWALLGLGGFSLLAGWLRGHYNDSYLIYIIFLSVGLNWLYTSRPYRAWNNARVALSTLYTYTSRGIIFFTPSGQGFGANQYFCTLFQLPPHTTLTFDFFDSFLHNQDSWRVLSRLKDCTQHICEGEGFLDLYLRQSVVRIKITVRHVCRKNTAWFLEIVNDQLHVEKDLLEKILDTIPNPTMIISRKNTLIDSNCAFNTWLGRYPADGENDISLKEYLHTLPTHWETGLILSFRQEGKNLKKARILKTIPLLQQWGLCVIMESAEHHHTPPGKDLLDYLPVPALIVDKQGYILATNTLFGYWIPETRLQHKAFTQWLDIKDQKLFINFLQQVRSQPIRQQPFFTIFHGHSKKNISIEANYQFLKGVQKNHEGFLLILSNLSTTHPQKSQELESQKLQALGRLAAGVIHDFNNLLTVMLGFCDLLLQRHSAQDSSFSDIMQIKENAIRASHFVRQLLLFAREAPPQLKVLNIRHGIDDMALLLKRLIGPTIELKVQHNTQDAFIYCDLSQIEQIIMNLAINGRDAMPKGGKLIIRSRTIVLKAPLQLYKHILKPDNYVVIDIQDTGCGIAKKDIEKIFDPFFSTKSPDQGTGLGLANVVQILQKVSGGIALQTHSKTGTTFSIYIPRCMHDQSNVLKKNVTHTTEVHKDLKKNGRILFVEDEDSIRLFACRALRNHGYEVFEASNGKKGLDFLKNNPKIDLLITDVMMPGIDGPNLVKMAFELDARLKVLFVSGYPEDQLHASFSAHWPGTVYFLLKPFNLKELQQKVGHILNHAVKEI